MIRPVTAGTIDDEAQLYIRSGLSSLHRKETSEAARQAAELWRHNRSLQPVAPQMLVPLLYCTKTLK